MVADLLEQIADSDAGLSRAETKVADAVLADPEGAIRSSIANLASLAAVSEPTVLRFCRSVGCDGFSDFKVRLAQSLVTGTPYVHVKVAPHDAAGDVLTKVFAASIDTLARVRDRLDPAAVSRAIDALARARRIECYGLGASGVVAADAQHKLFRLGVPCIACADTHMQIMAAASLNADDAVLAISHTGRSIDLIESARTARHAGATVIGITSPGSPLSEVCTETLGVAAMENTDVYTPMTSRLAHLVVVDVLAVGVALRGGAAAARRLGTIKEHLKGKRLGRRDL